MQQLLCAKTSRPKRGGFTKKSWRMKPLCGTPARLLLILAVAFCAQLDGAFAQTAQIATEQAAGAQAGVQMGLSQPGRSVSKFEARRIRRRCRDQVGNSAGSKELRHCFEVQVAVRRLWGECKRSAQIAKLRGHEKDEAVRRCAAEKLQQQQSKPASR